MSTDIKSELRVVNSTSTIERDTIGDRQVAQIALGCEAASAQEPLPCHEESSKDGRTRAIVQRFPGGVHCFFSVSARRCPTSASPSGQPPTTPPSTATTPPSAVDASLRQERTPLSLPPPSPPPPLPTPPAVQAEGRRSPVNVMPKPERKKSTNAKMPSPGSSASRSPSPESRSPAPKSRSPLLESRSTLPESRSTCPPRPTTTTPSTETPAKLVQPSPPSLLRSPNLSRISHGSPDDGGGVSGFSTSLSLLSRSGTGGVSGNEELSTSISLLSRSAADSSAPTPDVSSPSTMHTEPTWTSKSVESSGWSLGKEEPPSLAEMDSIPEWDQTHWSEQIWASPAGPKAFSPTTAAITGARPFDSRDSTWKSASELLEDSDWNLDEDMDSAPERDERSTIPIAATDRHLQPPNAPTLSDFAREPTWYTPIVSSRNYGVIGIRKHGSHIAPSVAVNAPQVRDDMLDPHSFVIQSPEPPDPFAPSPERRPLPYLPQHTSGQITPDIPHSLDWLSVSSTEPRDSSSSLFSPQLLHSLDAGQFENTAEVTDERFPSFQVPSSEENFLDAVSPYELYTSSTQSFIHPSTATREHFDRVRETWRRMKEVMKAEESGIMSTTPVTFDSSPSSSNFHSRISNQSVQCPCAEPARDSTKIDFRDLVTPIELVTKNDEKHDSMTPGSLNDSTESRLLPPRSLDLSKEFPRLPPTAPPRIVKVIPKQYIAPENIFSQSFEFADSSSSPQRTTTGEWPSATLSSLGTSVSLQDSNRRLFVEDKNAPHGYRMPELDAIEDPVKRFRKIQSMRNQIPRPDESSRIPSSLSSRYALSSHSQSPLSRRVTFSGQPQSTPIPSSARSFSYFPPAWSSSAPVSLIDQTMPSYISTSGADMQRSARSAGFFPPGWHGSTSVSLNDQTIPTYASGPDIEICKSAGSANFFPPGWNSSTPVSLINQTMPTYGNISSLGSSYPVNNSASVTELFNESSRILECSGRSEFPSESFGKHSEDYISDLEFESPFKDFEEFDTTSIQADECSLNYRDVPHHLTHISGESQPLFLDSQTTEGTPVRRKISPHVVPRTHGTPSSAHNLSPDRFQLPSPRTYEHAKISFVRVDDLSPSEAAHQQRVEWARRAARARRTNESIPPKPKSRITLRRRLDYSPELPDVDANESILDNERIDLVDDNFSQTLATRDFDTSFRSGKHQIEQQEFSARNCFRNSIPMIVDESSGNMYQLISPSYLSHELDSFSPTSTTPSKFNTTSLIRLNNSFDLSTDTPSQYLSDDPPLIDESEIQASGVDSSASDYWHRSMSDRSNGVFDSTPPSLASSFSISPIRNQQSQTPRQIPIVIDPTTFNVPRLRTRNVVLQSPLHEGRPLEFRLSHGNSPLSSSTVHGGIIQYFQDPHRYKVNADQDSNLIESTEPPQFVTMTDDSVSRTANDLINLRRLANYSRSVSTPTSCRPCSSQASSSKETSFRHGRNTPINGTNSSIPIISRESTSFLQRNEETDPVASLQYERELGSERNRMWRLQSISPMKLNSNENVHPVTTTPHVMVSESGRHFQRLDSVSPIIFESTEDTGPERTPKNFSVSDSGRHIFHGLESVSPIALVERSEDSSSAPSQQHRRRHLQRLDSISPIIFEGIDNSGPSSHLTPIRRIQRIESISPIMLHSSKHSNTTDRLSTPLVVRKLRSGHRKLWWLDSVTPPVLEGSDSVTTMPYSTRSSGNIGRGLDSVTPPNFSDQSSSRQP